MVRLEQKLAQKQILSPQQILQATLLQLNTINLEQKIIEELESNPVLESVDPPVEEAPAQEETIPNELDWEREDTFEPPRVFDSRQETPDMPLPDRRDFIDDLVEQLDLCELEDWEREIALEILWNLDDRGYLTVDLVLIADRFGKEEAEVERILKVVQHLNPPGIAARNLRECLLVQLDGNPQSLAYRIIDKQFDNLANHRYEAILSSLGCTEEELTQALEEISRLNPRPGEGQSLTKDQTVIPDLRVVEQDGKWVVLLNDNWLPDLRINSQYASMLQSTGQMDAAAQKYIKQKLDSAHWFIQAIEQRRRTLVRVMEAIIARQPEFFQGLVDQLRPMKLQDIADDIGMDISTISRSTRGKYVDTPFGVFELKSFFTEAFTLDSGQEISTHQIKVALKEIIEQEDKHHPYTDAELMQLLNERGFPVARRTVAKYREQLHYPVARLRRTL